MTDNIDNDLRAYAERWRKAQPLSSPPAISGGSATPKSGPRVGHSALLIATAATVAVVAVAVVAAARHASPTRVSTSNSPAALLARPPLVFSAQGAPRLLHLTTGSSGSLQWMFLAGYIPTETPEGLGPGICLSFATTGSGVSHCDDPATTPSLTANVEPLQSDPPMLLVAGVTSAPAATFSVTIGTMSVSTPALTTPALVGLRFYAVQVPAAGRKQRLTVAVEARAADGTGLLRNDPQLTATLQPLRPRCEAHGPCSSGPP